VRHNKVARCDVSSGRSALEGVGHKGPALAAIGVALGCVLVTTLAVPFLVLAAGGIGRANGESCSLPLPATAGTAPTILGSATLSAERLGAWWSETGRDEPSKLPGTVPQLIDMYLDEGSSEGVRGDIAFAQAVLETGSFTSSDTALNNFAGIVHYDGASHGRAFTDPRTGVRAHIQLLRKYAAGNNVQLAAPDVAPRAGAQATTWSDLAGTWASDRNYWTSLSAVYSEMLQSAGARSPSSPQIDPCATEPDPPVTPTQAGGTSTLATVRGITVSTEIADQLERLLAAAEADGLLLSGYGYRSHEQQIDLRKAHCGSSTYAIYEAPASSCSPPTARPGNSQHEVGLAIDFANCSTHSTRCWQWLNTHAATFGFFNLPSEPWHWSTSGA
jgi:hypothetical protein